MKKHKEKMRGPIIATVVLILYLCLYFGFLIHLIPWMILKGILAVIPVGCALALTYVCLERIREIKSGEEDDLDKY